MFGNYEEFSQAYPTATKSQKEQALSYAVNGMNNALDRDGAKMRMVDQMLSDGVDPTPAVYGAANTKNLDLLKRLKGMGANLDPKDQNGISPLGYIAMEYPNRWRTESQGRGGALYGADNMSKYRRGKRDLATIKFLIENGADVNLTFLAFSPGFKASSHKSLLKISEEFYDRDLARILRDNGAQSY